MSSQEAKNPPSGFREYPRLVAYMCGPTIARPLAWSIDSFSGCEKDFVSSSGFAGFMLGEAARCLEGFLCLKASAESLLKWRWWS